MRCGKRDMRERDGMIWDGQAMGAGCRCSLHWLLHIGCGRDDFGILWGVISEAFFHHVLPLHFLSIGLFLSFFFSFSFT